VNPGWIGAGNDQDSDACATYEENFGRAPVRRTLEDIDSSTLPEAGFWWLSPPCAPFSRRGARRDADDPRALPFLRLISEAVRHRDRGGPRILVVENVAGFLDSEVHHHLRDTWTAAGFAVAHVMLCPTRFGIPMKRPRVFVVAVAGSAPPVLTPPLRTHSTGLTEPLANHLDPAAMEDPALRLPAEDVARYGRSLNVIDPAAPDACAICFTSGYGRSWKAAGSYIRCPDGALRRFAPGEILRLLGFPRGFRFPGRVGLQRRWHLAGNSLSLDCVGHVLGQLRL
jgi:DNA (cytosine-5)-methyltransferase 1/tRNA (cytosine38-C5)-methyltransferase